MWPVHAHPHPLLLHLSTLTAITTSLIVTPLPSAVFRCVEESSIGAVVTAGVCPPHRR